MAEEEQRTESLEEEHFQMLYLSKLRKQKMDLIHSLVARFKEATQSSQKASTVEELRKLALSEHGLVDTELRQEVWPILLNVEAIVSRERKEKDLPQLTQPLKHSTEWKKYVKEYPDRRQVEVDVHRTLHTLDICQAWSDEEKKKKQNELQELIDATLVKTLEVDGEKMNYYQGMNDVAAVMLLTLGPNSGFQTCEIASRFLLTDFLQLPFDQGLVPLFHLVFFLLKSVDPDLYSLVSDDGLQPMPIFATSWILTTFAHDIESLEAVQRLYDVLLASHPLMIVYLCVAMIKLYEEELEENAEEMQSSVCFFVFRAPLKKLNSLDQVNRLVSLALEFEEQLPIALLLDQAQTEEAIELTKRDQSPFRQLYAGQLLGLEESSSQKEQKEAQLLRREEARQLQEEIQEREAEILERKKLEALDLGIDVDQLEQSQASTTNTESKGKPSRVRREKVSFKHRPSGKLRAAQAVLGTAIVFMAYYAFQQMAEEGEL